MFTFKTTPKNSVSLTHTVYLPHETNKAIIHRKFETEKEVKTFVVTTCYYLINFHFDALFKYFNMNRDYIYMQCTKQRIKISDEDYTYTDKLCRLQELKEAFHADGNSMYKQATLVVNNADLLRSMIQGMKIKSGASIDVLNDLLKEAKTILRNIQ